jgi:hypothetical protein
MRSRADAVRSVLAVDPAAGRIFDKVDGGGRRWRWTSPGMQWRPKAIATATTECPRERCSSGSPVYSVVEPRAGWAPLRSPWLLWRGHRGRCYRRLGRLSVIAAWCCGQDTARWQLRLLNGVSLLGCRPCGVRVVDESQARTTMPLSRGCQPRVSRQCWGCSSAGGSAWSASTRGR